MGVESMSFT